MKKKEKKDGMGRTKFIPSSLGSQQVGRDKRSEGDVSDVAFKL
jgi:hypothetical protein